MLFESCGFHVIKILFNRKSRQWTARVSWKWRNSCECWEIKTEKICNRHEYKFRVKYCDELLLQDENYEFQPIRYLLCLSKSTNFFTSKIHKFRTIQIARWKRFEIYKCAFFYFHFCYLHMHCSSQYVDRSFSRSHKRRNACIITLCLNTLYQSELACSFNPRNSRRSSLRLWSSTFFLPFGFPDLIPSLLLERSHDIYLLACTLFLMPPGEIVYNWPYYEILPLSYLRKLLRNRVTKRALLELMDRARVILNNDGGLFCSVPWIAERFNIDPGSKRVK